MKSLQEAKSIAEAECTESTNKYRKTSRFAIRVVIVVIALGLRSVGVTGLITEHRQKQAEAQQSQASKKLDCPLSTDATVNRCMVNESGVHIMTEESVNPDVFQFCWVRPEGSIIESKWLGPSTLEIKSGSGTFPLEYKWVRKSALVDGKCPNKF